MCGIAGILNFNRDNLISQKRLSEMRDVIKHRGPDAAGIYINKNIGFAHRRLSIIDLSEGGIQPFSSDDGRYTIVFNGEIYNYLEIRKILEEKGEVFRTKTDTEVLLKLFIERGVDCLELLNGMFSFAIWDNTTKKLIIVRDRIGVKPLYYSIFNEALFFASEIKSILCAGVPAEINKDGLEEHLLFRYIAGENTLFKYVKRLLPGHFMQIDATFNVEIKRWWNLSEKIQNNREHIPKRPFEWFEETFYSAVKYRTISDVPIGLMLSGGLDSGSIAVALANNGEKNLSSFTVSFQEKEYNESHLAKLVSDKFNLNFHQVELEGDKLLEELKEATWLLDEPLVHQNDAQMLGLAKYAKNYVSVLLSGEGGDEFIGGYVRYKPLNYYNGIRLAAAMSPILKFFDSSKIVNRFEKLERYLKNRPSTSLVSLNAADTYPLDLLKMGYDINIEKFTYRQTILKEAQKVYPLEYSRQAMYLDLFIHMSSVLDRNDRMTMGAGIECRVPFMDYRLMEMIPALPSNLLLKGKKGKFLLFNSVAKKLPEEVLRFKKLGFSVPWEKYLTKDDVFNTYLIELERHSEHHFFDKIDTKMVIKLFKAGNPVGRSMLRHLFMFDQWYDGYFKIFNK